MEFSHNGYMYKTTPGGRGGRKILTGRAPRIFVVKLYLSHKC